MGYFGKALSPSSYLPVHVSAVLEHSMYSCMYSSRNAALLEPLLCVLVHWRTDWISHLQQIHSGV